MVFARRRVVEGHGLKPAVRRRQLRGSHAVHHPLVGPPVVNDLADPHHRDGRLAQARGQPCVPYARGVRAVGLGEHSHRCQPSQHGQIDRRLGVPQPPQNAAFTCPYWRDRAGRAEVGSVAFGRRQRPHDRRESLVVRGRDFVHQSNGAGQRWSSGQRVGQLRRLFRQPQIVKAKRGGGSVDLAGTQVAQSCQGPSVQGLAGCYEINVRLRESVIDDGHNAAAANAGNCGFHRVVGHRDSSSL